MWNNAPNEGLFACMLREEKKSCQKVEHDSGGTLIPMCGFFQAKINGLEPWRHQKSSVPECSEQQLRKGPRTLRTHLDLSHPWDLIHLHLKHYLFELLNLHHLKIILSTKHIYENSIQYPIEWYINFRGRELIWYDLSIQTTTIFFKTSVPIVNISSPIYSLYIKQSYHYKLHSKFYKKIPILVGFKSLYDELYLFRQCIFLERVLHMNRVIFTNIQYLHKPIIPWQRAFNIIFNDI
jgi:hypothetical protein